MLNEFCYIKLMGYDILKARSWSVSSAVERVKWFHSQMIPQSNDTSLKLCKKEATSYLFNYPQYIFALISKLVSISEDSAKTLSEVHPAIDVWNSFSDWRNCSALVPSGNFYGFFFPLAF